MEKIKALILAAGKGERMKSLFPDTPKSLIPFKGKPLIEHFIKLLHKYKIKDILLNIKDNDINRFRYLKLPVLIETKPLGNAGAIKKFIHQLGERFLVFHGDLYTDVNIDKLIKAHLSQKGLMTMMIKRISTGKNLGLVVREKERVIGFTRERFVNCGIYICHKKISNYIGQGFQDLDQDLFPVLIKDKMLFTYTHQGVWYDLGTPESYREYNKSPVQ